MTGAEPENEFVAHWRSLPRDGLVPSLSAYLDRPHPRFSPWVFIVDVVSEDNLTVRLFGTRMADNFGEITGLNLLDFLKRDLRPTIGRAHNVICSVPCGWLTSSRALTTAGREVVAETVSLPLIHKGVPRCVVKLTNILAELDFHDGGAQVENVRPDHWIDIGAGLPQAVG